MHIKVVTLRYDENLGGFPEEPLRRAAGSGAVLGVREYFFTHGNVPHLALVMELDRTDGVRPPQGQRVDPGESLPESLRPLYRELRTWRNERAKQDGVPAYVILRNAQAADICRAVPRSLSALQQIEGIGEATCARYGKDILARIPKELKPEAAPTPKSDEGPTAPAPRPSPDGSDQELNDD